MTDEFLRKSTTATLNEIIDREREFKEQHGIDLRDEDEWKLLGEYVRLIEDKITPKKDAAE